MNDTFKSWLYVIIQAILLVGLVFAPASTNPPLGSIVIALVIQIVGLIILVISLYQLRRSLTALPMPTRSGQLQVHGLYRYVRHPMYVGVLTLSLGIAIAGYSLAHLLIFAGLYALFHFKARYEEQLLLAKYPGYQAYMRRTPRFVPRLDSR